MKTKLAVALALAASLFTSPAFADGIIGNWTCDMVGIAVGDLHIEQDGYAFMRPGVSITSVSADETALGAYVETSMVHISDGPLRDLFGIKLGFLNEIESPARLVFNIRPGLGLSCKPV